MTIDGDELGEEPTTEENGSEPGGAGTPSAMIGEDLPMTADGIIVHLDLPWAEARRRLERRYFTVLLERHRGNVAGVARAAGLDPANLRRVLRRHGLTPSAFRPDPEA